MSPLRILVLSILTLLAVEAASARPNIVLLVADDLGSGELATTGDAARVPTPHLDRLAASGVRCTAGYVTASYCAPSRAGLLAGRLQTRFGFEGNPTGLRNTDPAIGLPTGERLLPQLLHDAGYATALIGKWHLGATPAFHPQRRGFDEFFGFLHEGHFYVPSPWDGVATHLRRKALPDGGKGVWMNGERTLQLSTAMGYDEPLYDTDNPILRGSQPVDEHTYLTDAFTREAVSFIRRAHERPFLLTVAYNAVHSPMQGADAYLARFADTTDLHRRIFAAMLANLDDSVGAIVQTLGEVGVADNTLVVFISDNGGATRELTSRNTPFRGEKGSLYEGGIRVPFILSFPGRIPAAGTYAPAVSTLDLLPTACALAGITAPATCDGVDLLPYVSATDNGLPHRSLYWRMHERSAYRDGDFKLVRHRRDAAWELYDLAADPGETTDLAARDPARVARLAQAWEQQDREMVMPLF